MMWFGIAGCLVAIVCIGLLFMAGARINTREEVLMSERENLRVKTEFMIRELGEVFKQWDVKKKTHLCGMLETLEWINGDRKDEQFIGWVLAKKNVIRKEKK